MYESYPSEPLATQICRELNEIIAPKKTGIFAFFCCCSAEPRDVSVDLIEQLVSLINNLSKPEKKKTSVRKERRLDSLPNLASMAINGEDSPLLKQSDDAIIMALLHTVRAYINASPRLEALIHTKTLEATINRYIKLDTSKEIPEVLLTKLRNYLNKPNSNNIDLLVIDLTHLITDTYTSRSGQTNRTTSAMYIPAAKDEPTDDGIATSLASSLSASFHS